MSECRPATKEEARDRLFEAVRAALQESHPGLVLAWDFWLIDEAEYLGENGQLREALKRAQDDLAYYASMGRQKTSGNCGLTAWERNDPRPKENDKSPSDVPTYPAATVTPKEIALPVEDSPERDEDPPPPMRPKDLDSPVVLTIKQDSPEPAVAVPVPKETEGIPALEEHANQGTPSPIEPSKRLSAADVELATSALPKSLTLDAPQLIQVVRAVKGGDGVCDLKNSLRITANEATDLHRWGRTHAARLYGCSPVEEREYLADLLKVLKGPEPAKEGRKKR